MKRLALLLTFLISLPAAADETDTPHVIAQLPAQELRVGDLVDVPVIIDSEAMEIVSYGIELKYDSARVRLLEIRPGLSPVYGDMPRYNARAGSVLLTGSANAFGENPRMVNVAIVRFELIDDGARPAFQLAEAGPLVRREGFAAVEAVYSVQGEMDLWNMLFNAGFE